MPLTKRQLQQYCWRSWVKCCRAEGLDPHKALAKLLRAMRP